MQALEKQLGEAERAAARAEPKTEHAEPQPRRRPREHPPARSRRPSAFNPGISLILPGHLRAHSRRIPTIRITGFVPRAVKWAAAQELRPRRDRAYVSRRAIDPYFRARRDRAHAGERGRSGGGVLPDARAAAGLTSQGRPLLSGIGYSERVPSARLGLPVTRRSSYKAFLGTATCMTARSSLGWRRRTPSSSSARSSGKARASRATVREKNGAARATL